MKPITLLLFCLLFVTGCPDPAALVAVSPLPTPTAVEGKQIAFETLVRGEYSSYSGEEPLLLLIHNLDDLTPILNYMSPDEQSSVVAEVENLSDAPGVVVALFRGNQGSSGYEIHIERVIKQKNQIHLYVQFWEPGPTYPVTGAETSPYEIIKLHWSPGTHESIEIELDDYIRIHR
jgi:hypothetical protein